MSWFEFTHRLPASTTLTNLADFLLTESATFEDAVVTASHSTQLAVERYNLTPMVVVFLGDKLHLEDGLIFTANFYKVPVWTTAISCITKPRDKQYIHLSKLADANITKVMDLHTWIDQVVLAGYFQIAVLATQFKK